MQKGSLNYSGFFHLRGSLLLLVELIHSKKMLEFRDIFRIKQAQQLQCFDVHGLKWENRLRKKSIQTQLTIMVEVVLIADNAMACNVLDNDLLS